MQIQPYLFFDGRCDEAIEFYKKALGAKVQMLLRFKDGPPTDPEKCGGVVPPADNVMHAHLKIGDSDVLVSDGQSTGVAKFDGFTLAMPCKSVEEVDRYFAVLSEGGTTIMPLGKTFFSPKFGMLADKFGVHWMLLVESGKPG